MPLAVIYARTSTEEQKISIEEQVRLCREWCERNNVTVLMEIKEHVSGATPPEKRPEFRKIFQLLELGIKFDYLVVYSLDRLTRSIRRLLSLLLDFSQRGIIVVSISPNEEWTQKVVDPTMRDFLVSVLGFFAEWWLKEIRRRTKEALSSSEVRAKIDKRKKIDKILPEVKDAIVTLYTLKGYSIRKLAQMFNLSEYLVRKILIEKGVLSLHSLICPKCLHRLEWDDVERTYKCKNCGYVLQSHTINTILNLRNNN